MSAVLVPEVSGDWPLYYNGAGACPLHPPTLTGLSATTTRSIVMTRGVSLESTIKSEPFQKITPETEQELTRFNVERILKQF